MEKEYLCADLYDAAFLLSYGAAFKKIVSYYKNHRGKSFSVMALTNVTWEMLQSLEDPKATVSFHKLKEYRKRLKEKAEKHASENKYTEITSKEVFKIRQSLRKQYNSYKEIHSSSGPRRIMAVEEGYEDNNESAEAK